MSLSHNGRGSTLSCVLKGANMNMHKSVLATMVMVAVFAVDSVFAACNPVGTSCSSCTTYRCNSGYYGTARSASSGCTKCPSNATCAGGNGSTFVCAKGYTIKVAVLVPIARITGQRLARAQHRYPVAISPAEPQGQIPQVRSSMSEIVITDAWLYM